MAVKELPWEQGCCVDLRLPALQVAYYMKASSNIFFVYTITLHQLFFCYLENNPSTVTAA